MIFRYGLAVVIRGSISGIHVFFSSVDKVKERKFQLEKRTKMVKEPLFGLNDQLIEVSS